METVKSKIRCAVCESRTRAGVTLIEMLMVVAVVALLATIVIGTATHIQNQGNEQVTANIFELLDGALQEYYDYNGYFREQIEYDFTKAAEHSEMLYEALNSVPSSRKILENISDTLIKHGIDTGVIPPIPEIYDPWGTVLDYTYVDGDSFPKLRSAGPDKMFGTADDITSR